MIPAFIEAVKRPRCRWRCCNRSVVGRAAVGPTASGKLVAFGAGYRSNVVRTAGTVEAPENPERHRFARIGMRSTRTIVG